MFHSQSQSNAVTVAIKVTNSLAIVVAVAFPIIVTVVVYMAFEVTVIGFLLSHPDQCQGNAGTLQVQ